MVEQKRQNKNDSLFQVTETKIGGDSASAKKAAEQKLVGGTKKRSAEQKLVSGTKTAEQKLVSGTKKRSAEQKLVSRTKKRSVEQKLVSGTKMAEQKLVGGTKKRSAEQKLMSGTKTVEQKLFIILSHPNKNLCGQCKCKKGQWNRNWWALLAIG